MHVSCCAGCTWREIFSFFPRAIEQWNMIHSAILHYLLYVCINFIIFLNRVEACKRESTFEYYPSSLLSMCGALHFYNHVSVHWTSFNEFFLLLVLRSVKIHFKGENRKDSCEEMWSEYLKLRMTQRKDLMTHEIIWGRALIELNFFKNSHSTFSFPGDRVLSTLFMHVRS